MTPTIQQQAFINFCLNNTAHGALIARAGCGKTSTIMLAVAALTEKFPQAEITVCAYNKPIAKEVDEKMKKAGYRWPKIQASTIHSMGYGLIKFAFKSEIEDAKVRKIIRSLADHEEDRLVREYGVDSPERPRNLVSEYRSQIDQLVHLAKQAGVGFFEDLSIANVAVWTTLADHYDVNGLDNTAEIDDIVLWAQRVYKISLADTKTIDFDDMILFPLIKNIHVKFGRDYIFLDEAQDLSRARQALAKKFLKPTGRMFIIGDDRQAIYGFSGADADALNNLVSSLHATVLPLTVTWRCPKAVVKVAQQYVSDIQAADTAPEGEVSSITEVPANLTVGDAVLCRNTAPLVELCYRFIREGKAAKVEGRSIGEGLIQITNRWKVTTIDAFLKRLEAYRSREVQKAQAKDKDQKVEQINDMCDTLVELCRVCIGRQQTSLQSVRDFISEIFDDNNKDSIILATYHRSKGREWKNVYLYEHSRYSPSKYAKQDWQKRQEENLAYVAVTRAMSTLTYINLAPSDKPAAK